MIIRRMCEVLAIGLCLASTAANGDVRQTLSELQQCEVWGEARLRDGAVRPVRVLFLSADSVWVQEVVGALHERPATYGLKEIESLRVLGQYRIPRNPAPYRGPRSTWTALGLELVVPGGGFFYIGQPRQGWSLLAFSAAAVATAGLTGKDGAAGWVPFAVWTKAAALAQVRDEVAALNAAHDAGLARAWDRGPQALASLVELRVPF